MTMKKLLGISLAMVMLVGSIPFGFAQTDNSTNPNVPDLEIINDADYRKPSYVPMDLTIEFYVMRDANGDKLTLERLDVYKFEIKFFDSRIGIKGLKPEMKAQAQAFGMDDDVSVVDWDKKASVSLQRDLYFIKAYLGQSMSKEEIDALTYSYRLTFDGDADHSAFPDYVEVKGTTREFAKEISEYPTNIQDMFSPIIENEIVMVIAPINKVDELENLPNISRIEGISYVKPLQVGWSPSPVYQPSQLLSPVKQMENGLLPFQIQCNEGKDLAKKYDNSPVCVSVDSIDRLEQRNWLSRIGGL